MQVQFFLRFANFYKKFIYNYSAIAKALTDLTKKDQDFKWTTEARNAFQILKKRFT